MTDRTSPNIYAKELMIWTKQFFKVIADLDIQLNNRFKDIDSKDGVIETLDSFINLLYGTIYDTEEIRDHVEDIIYRIQND